MKHSGLFGLVRSGVGGAVVLTGFLLAGCATGPDAHPRDPLEPWNRGVFRFNDAILRNLVIKRDEADTEQSLIMKSKDEKGDKPERGERRRRDDDEAINSTNDEAGDDAVAE